MERHDLVPWVVGFAVAWRGKRTLKRHLDLGVVLLCSRPPSSSDLCRRAHQQAAQKGILEAITKILGGSWVLINGVISRVTRIIQNYNPY